MSSVSGADRGREAEHPGQIPARGWRDVAARVKEEATDDQVVLLSAGVAFFWLLSLVPTLIAALSIYGIVADPDQVRRQLDDVAEALPASAQDLLTEQVAAVTERSTTGLGLGALLAIVLALWSASSGVRHLIEAVNAAYDEDESRGPLRRYAQALVFATAAIVGGVVAVGLISVLPSVLEAVSLGDAATVALSLLRWPLLAALFAGALGVLYRNGPDRDAPRMAWFSWGAGVATALWLAGSVLFSVYADRLGSFDSTYGSLAGVVVLMLWLQLTALAVLVGAELNSELERQTRRDSTVGPTREPGRRDAHAADTVGPTAQEVSS
jgi:membrane protein